jgi:hypothetical protein
MWRNHHQALRSKQCTPKFFINTPPHQGEKPSAINATNEIINIWKKRANKFAECYLTLF